MHPDLLAFVHDVPTRDRREDEVVRLARSGVIADRSPTSDGVAIEEPSRLERCLVSRII
jgi:hypothetical protein